MINVKFFFDKGLQIIKIQLHPKKTLELLKTRQFYSTR